MKRDTFEQIRDMAADLLGAAAAEITPESSPETLENWDSVQHLNLILAVEQRFELQFDPEEIESMENLGAIARVVERKQGRVAT
jgi:acyl carrier protein